MKVKNMKAFCTEDDKKIFLEKLKRTKQVGNIMHL